MEEPLKWPRRWDSSTMPPTGVPLGTMSWPLEVEMGSTTSPSKWSPVRLVLTLMCWLMRIWRSVPAGMWTSAGLMTIEVSGAGAAGDGWPPAMAGWLAGVAGAGV